MYPSVTAEIFLCTLCHAKEKAELAGGVTLTPASVASKYRDEAARAESQEELTDACVDMAISVFKRALTLPQVMKVVRLSEERYGSRTVFDSICKMQACLQKAGLPKYVEWVFTGIWDLFEHGELPGGVSVRALQGDRQTKSLPEILIEKYKFNEWLVKKHLPTLKISTEERVAIEACCTAGFEHFRSKCGCAFGQGGGKVVDVSWRGGWSKCADKVMELFEAFGVIREGGIGLGISWAGRCTRF